MLHTKNNTECKFQPEINRAVPNYENKEPIMIKGFAKYLEQMEKARKAKRDKEQREKEVFVSGENWSRDNLITIPRPFNLSHQKADNTKKEEFMKKIREEELKGCTFKPATNES